MTKKRIYLNAFDINSAGHHSPGLWTHPEDKSSTYKDEEYSGAPSQSTRKGKV